MLERSAGSAGTSRDTLHRLVDQLPGTLLDEAERYLLSLQHDPVLRAFAGATMSTDPLTEEQIVAIEDGEAEMARGETIPWKIVQVRVFGGA